MNSWLLVNQETADYRWTNNTGAAVEVLITIMGTRGGPLEERQEAHLRNPVRYWWDRVDDYTYSFQSKNGQLVRVQAANGRFDVLVPGGTGAYIVDWQKQFKPSVYYASPSNRWHYAQGGSYWYNRDVYDWAQFDVAQGSNPQLGQARSFIITLRPNENVVVSLVNDANRYHGNFYICACVISHF
ncbi:hypothetical protein NHP190002_05460 [Helicobacter ailurogastricus]|uniref:hypothetical protein n=1 Tax=Helicobacter ailurogastricus TaxID=1578720 RepID=UPI00244D8D67|nr:hypothetical protein [Helicobacter ailurogastricus]GMB89867.1 hypothetical protein NHP190002_05460 [Helicobacter ailurogastricus]